MIKGRLFFLVLPPLLVLALGCTTSNTPSTVTGKVTYNDKPVTAGTVTFQMEAGGTYRCPIKADGTYSSLGEIPAGDGVVTIETESANKDKKQPVYGGGRGGPNGGMGAPPSGAEMGSASAGDYVKIPAKFSDPKKSGLTAKVAKGSNKFNFDLKD